MIQYLAILLDFGKMSQEQPAKQKPKLGLLKSLLRNVANRKFLILEPCTTSYIGRCTFHSEIFTSRSWAARGVRGWPRSISSPYIPSIIILPARLLLLPSIIEIADKQGFLELHHENTQNIILMI